MIAISCPSTTIFSVFKYQNKKEYFLCANSTGTHKIQPLVIGKSLKPRCFKNVKSLPVEYRANKKAWMTSKLFSEWLQNLDNDMKKKKKKIALLVDNCTAHSLIPKLQNIEIVFFPANCTSILQPLDMGIIKCFKGYYRKRLVDSALVNIENKVENPLKGVNIKEACDNIAGSWWEVTEKTISNCWRKAGISLVEDDDRLEIQEKNDVSDEVQCAKNLERSVAHLEERTAKKFEISVEDYLTADDEIMVFAGISDEDILSEITDEKENDAEEEEDDDDEDTGDPSHSLLTAHEALQSIQSLRTFFSSLPSTNVDHFRALDSMHRLVSDLTVKKMNKQTKIMDFFK